MFARHFVGRLGFDFLFDLCLYDWGNRLIDSFAAIMPLNHFLIHVVRILRPWLKLDWGQTFDKVPAAVAISSLDELRSVGDNLLGNNRCVRSTDLLNSRIWTFWRCAYSPTLYGP